MLTIVPDRERRLAYRGERRIDSIGVLRALCAFGVVAIHVAAGESSRILGPLYALAVPLFFVITGYFLLDGDGLIQPRRVERQIVKIFKIDIAANVFYVVFYGLMSHVIKNPMARLATPSAWLEQALSGALISTPLWYLHALLVALLIIRLLCTTRRRLSLLTAIALAGLVLNLVWSFIAPALKVYPLTTYTFSFLHTALPMIGVGVVIRLNQHLLTSRPAIVVLSMVAAVTLTFAAAHLTGSAAAPLYALSRIAAVATVFPTVLLADRLQTSRVLRAAARFGSRHSLNIYIFHIAVFRLIALLMTAATTERLLLVIVATSILSVALKRLRTSA
jgi:peptidoglycan/LPS O-acetylase OafA/YrhL